MKERIGWETINQYVDGELPPRDAAEVAQAVATDPEYAEQVAVLSSLKAAVAHSTDGLGAKIKFRQPRKTKLRHTWIPLVASLATVLLLGSLMSILVLKTDFIYPVSGMRLAEAIHTEWLDSRAQQSDSGHEALLKTTLEGLYLDAYVPDLSKVDLSFSGIRRVTTHGVEGVHIGYMGPSGCMVSLVVFRNHIRLPEDIAYFKASERPVYGWRVGKTGFYLLAHKMDSSRLYKIAKVVHRLTRIRLPLDPQSIIVLRDARTSSEPCVT
jgi:hypothetical protein